MAESVCARQAARGEQLVTSSVRLRQLEACLRERAVIAKTQFRERTEDGMFNSLPGGPIAYLLIGGAWTIILLCFLGYIAIYKLEAYVHTVVAACVAFVGICLLCCWQCWRASARTDGLVDSCDATSDTEARVALQPSLDDV